MKNCDHKNGRCSSYINKSLISVYYVAIYLDEKTIKTDSSYIIIQKANEIEWNK